MRRATVGERLARMYAWTVVALRYPIILAWAAALVAALVYLPGLQGSGSASLGDIVPSDARAVRAQQRALQLFGSTLTTDVVVAERAANGLRIGDVESRVRAAIAASRTRPGGKGDAILAAVPLVNQPLPGLRWGERDTTLLTYLFLDPQLNLSEREAVAHRYAAALPPAAPGASRGVTGAGPARLEQFRLIDEKLPWVEVATILVIAAVVALYFRSIGAPLVTLATAGTAYVIAVRGLAWTAERAGVTAPSEIQPVLCVLLLGLVTDYTVFFMAETRSRLLRGEPRVVAAGTLVAAGAVSLLAARMEFLHVFGPGLAIAALVVTLVAVTLVPALAAAFGPWLFGRRVRGAQAASDRRDVADPAPSGRESRLPRLRGTWRASRRHARREGGHVLPRFVSRVLATRPFAAVLAIACIAGLVFAAGAARSTHLAVSFIPSLPRDTEVRQAAADAQRGFGPGILAPTEIVLEQPGIADRVAQLAALQRAVAGQRGVAAVLGPAQAPSGTPVEPFVVAKGGGAARLVVLLRDEPTSADAIGTVTRLEDRLPRLARSAGLGRIARVSYAGETALAAETVGEVASDARRVALVTALLTAVLLGLYLRAVAAPLILLLGSVLAFAGAFGLTALIIPGVLGGTDFINYVPLVAGVLLVGLGSDYNVFISGRIREEMRHRRMREAIATGGRAASRAITTAGVTLAATFALLAIVPLRPFRELALLMTIGVLLDALLVRPVLVPSLIAVVGKASWWPGRPRRALRDRAFTDAIAQRAGLAGGEARRVATATLATLAERIPAAELDELARHLPPEMAASLSGGRDTLERFGADEFVDRVAARTGTDRATAERDARAVLSVLSESLAPEELDYLRASLPDAYGPLFGDGVRRRAADPVAG